MELNLSKLGSLLIRASNRDAMGVILDDLIELFSEDFQNQSIFLETIDYLRGNNDYSVAIRFAENVINKICKNCLYLVVLGDLYSSQNRDKQAIDAYSEALLYDQNFFWARRNLALAYFKVGCYSECLPHLEAALIIAHSDQLKQEISRHIIDCQTYLDRPATDELKLADYTESTEIVELTAFYYPYLNVISVRTMGVVGSNLSLDDLTVDIVIDGATYRPSNLYFANNSLRRYCQLLSRESFEADFHIWLQEFPTNIFLRTSSGGSILQTLTINFTVVEQQQSDRRQPAKSKLAAFADDIYLTHQYDMASIFYALAISTKEAINDEHFVESLISVGRFHEAERHLTAIFDEPPPYGALSIKDSGKLFDLYCVEISRSRLPGWETKIEKVILDRLKFDPKDVSALTNLGHLRVKQRRISEAVQIYAEASDSSVGQDLIHFSRGIASARYATLDTTRDFSSLYKPADAAGLVHLFSCDAIYFNRYAHAIISSSCNASGAEHVIVHAHIVDPDISALKLAQRLQRTYSFNFTTEFSPFADISDGARIAYYTSARYINVPAIMKIYGRPIIVTETDCRINWSWEDIRAWCKDADVGYNLSNIWNWVPWTKIPAGIAYFNNSSPGKAVAAEIREFLMKVFATPEAISTNLWTVDQVALWISWEKFAKKANFVHIPMGSVLTLAIGDKTNIFDEATDENL